MRQTNGANPNRELKKLERSLRRKVRLQLSDLDDLAQVYIRRVTKGQWRAFKGAMAATRAMGNSLTVEELVRVSTPRIPQKLALALCLFAYGYNAVRLHFEVFHTCAEQALLCRDFEQGYHSLPWRCPMCSRLVRDHDELTYELRVFQSSSASPETV